MTLAARLRSMIEQLPPGAAVLLPADMVRGWLEVEPVEPAPQIVSEDPPGWRERLWTVPAATRMGVTEVAEACGRSKNWTYRATDKNRAKLKGREPLPCSRMDGHLTFSAGAVRDWLGRNERIVNAR